MADLHVVILAAGKGTRMKSSLPKVLHRVAGRPMIDYVLGTAARLAPKTTTVVVGHQLDALKAALTAHPGLQVVVQEPQLGTAHALLTTESALQGAGGVLVLLSGDVPLLSPATLKTLVERHAVTGAAVTTVAAAPVAACRSTSVFSVSGDRSGTSPDKRTTIPLAPCRADSVVRSAWAVPSWGS